MRRLIRLTLFLGMPLAAFVVWIEASEPLVPSMTLDAVLATNQKDDVIDERPFGIPLLQKTTDGDDVVEADFAARHRQAAFRDLHEQFVVQFSLIEGAFGNSRMLQLPSPSAINHSVRGGPSWVVFGSSLVVKIVGKHLVGQRYGQVTVHSVGIDEVLSDEVARFPCSDELQSLRYLGANPDQSLVEPSPGLFDESVDMINEPIVRTEWKLLRLELIGLLKHETPVSYTSPGIPKMNELGGVPTAPLNTFEQAAIDRMKANPGQEVVIQEDNDEIQIVGALRATERCQTCHKVNRGELLGGLTYRLIRSREVARN